MSRFIRHLNAQKKYNDSVGHLAREIVSDDHAEFVLDTEEAWREYLSKREASESETHAFQQAWREWKGNR